MVDHADIDHSGLTGVIDPDTMLPWHVSIIPMVMTPDATTGTWALASASAQILVPFYQPGSVGNSGYAVYYSNGSAAAQNDAAAWDVILAAGTWDFHAWVRETNVMGIITLNQDGSSMGTVDTYAASDTAAKVSITGWTVATTGKKRMQLKMATKNASSSNYHLWIQAIEFRRTA